MSHTANIEGGAHPLEEAGKTLEHLENVSASEMTDQQRRAFEIAKRNFSTHIDEAKKNPVSVRFLAELILPFLLIPRKKMKI